jgi:hypothetical protein
MKTLTLRAIKLNRLITEEWHTDNRGTSYINKKGSEHAGKRLERNPRHLKTHWPKGFTKRACMLAPHELDAVTAALTGYLHMRDLTETLGDRKEGFIIIPIRQDWRRIKL